MCKKTEYEVLIRFGAFQVVTVHARDLTEALRLAVRQFRHAPDAAGHPLGRWFRADGSAQIDVQAHVDRYSESVSAKTTQRLRTALEARP